LPFTVFQKLKLSHTAFAVTGTPSWNFLPETIRNVQTLPLDADSQLVARSGAGVAEEPR